MSREQNEHRGKVMPTKTDHQKTEKEAMERTRKDFRVVASFDTVLMG